MKTIAIIGTAGRDPYRTMDARLWRDMLDDLGARLDGPPNSIVLVSGGAAWADHLAVVQFLWGHPALAGLKLHLPAPFDHEALAFREMGRGSAGSAANYYHKRFSRAVPPRLRGGNHDSLEEIAAAHRLGAGITEQRLSVGYGGMHARNRLVAQDADEVIAYTWGRGDTPADGGTLSTWTQMAGKPRTHVSLCEL